MAQIEQKYNRSWAIMFSLLCLVMSAQAQDPVFSQFYNAPLVLNPAFAGVADHPVVSLTYRNQWPNLGNIYRTYSATYDQYIDKYKSGVGLAILSDDQGEGSLKSLKISGLYSYGIRIDRDHRLKIGAGLGFVQQRIDWSRLIFGDQIDEGLGVITQGGSVIPSSEQNFGLNSITYIDVSAGFLLTTPLYYVGMSIDHLNSPNQSFLTDSSVGSNLPLRFSVHGGVQINFDRGNKRDEGSFITPNILFEKQGDFYQVNVGAYTSLKSIFVGLWYRNAWSNNDALITSIGVKQGPFKIGYSFDYTISDLTIDSGGTHEIGILINFYGLKPRKSTLNDCLGLFR